MSEPRTLAQLAQEAIDVQDACNLSGVAQGFGRAIVELRHAIGGGSDGIRTHPITLLWIDKLTDMTSRGIDYHTAYATCLNLAGRSVDQTDQVRS
jgi:hypothetical protein